MTNRPPQPLALNRWDALELQADQANFVVISGIAIDVDNLMDALHGRDFTPTLTRAELNTAYVPDLGFHERMADGMKRRVTNAMAEKKRRIHELVQRSSIDAGDGVTDVTFPRREQILIALSQGRLRYSSLTEFLGQFAELTERDAELVARTVDETRGGLAEAQSANRVSARSISDALDARDLFAVKGIFGLKGMDAFPVSLLERAILEIPPHTDDFQYFEEIRGDRGVSVPFVFESVAANTVFGTTLLTMAASVPGVDLVGAYFPELAHFMFTPGGVYVLAGTAVLKLAQQLSKWTPITDRYKAVAHTRALQKSGQSLQRFYEDLAQKVSELKRTPDGAIRLLALKELVLANRDGGNHRSNLATVASWIRELQSDPVRREQFQDFAGTRLRAFERFDSAQELWAEFGAYQGAARELPDVESASAQPRVDEEEDKRRRAQQLSARSKVGN